MKQCNSLSGDSNELAERANICKILEEAKRQETEYVRTMQWQLINSRSEGTSSSCGDVRKRVMILMN